jgi:hypothetical protein
VILGDTSGVPLSDRAAEALAVMKEIMAYYEGHWSLAVPRRVLVDNTGEMGRIHLVAGKASSAAHAQHPLIPYGVRPGRQGTMEVHS